MLIVREVFIAKPGQASKLAKLFKNASRVMPGKVRIMTDLVGKFNKVVMETEVRSLAEFERRMKQYYKDAKLKNKMTGYTEMYQGGKREIYQVI